MKWRVRSGEGDGRLDAYVECFDPVSAFLHAVKESNAQSLGFLASVTSEAIEFDENHDDCQWVNVPNALKKAGMLVEEAVSAR